MSRKLIVFRPFKCWSSSITAYLTRSSSWLNVVGLDPFKDMTSPHTNAVYSHFEGYEKVLPVRDPIERVVSMWRYHRRIVKPIPFSEWSQSFFLDAATGPITDAYNATVFVDCELLEKFFLENGFSYGEFPHENKSGWNDGVDLSFEFRESVKHRYRVDYEKRGSWKPGRRGNQAHWFIGRKQGIVR